MESGERLGARSPREGPGIPSVAPALQRDVNKPRIAIIISSVRPTRIGPKVAEWILSQAPDDVDAEIVDLAEVNLPLFQDAEMPGKGTYDQPTTIAWAERVASYDGFIIALAEYNGGYTAALKNAIDTVGPQWRGKPIGLVGYGAYGGGRAVTAMEPVISTLRAHRIVGPELKFGEQLGYDGTFTDAPDSALADLYAQVMAVIEADERAA